MMLGDDILDGKVGTFRYKGEDVAYHVDGKGSPVLMTMGLSAIGGSYDWRYIYDCLSGAFQVYALDVLGLEHERHRISHGPCYYEEMIEEFLAKVIGKRSSIISGPVEAQYALNASFEHPKLVDKVVIVSPDGTRRIATHDTIGRSVLYRILQIPKVESIMYGSISSKRSMLLFLSNIHKHRGNKRPKPLYPSHMKPRYPPLALLSERRFHAAGLGRIADAGAHEAFEDDPESKAYGRGDGGLSHIAERPAHRIPEIRRASHEKRGAQVLRRRH